jgi:hypothetical protein
MMMSKFYKWTVEFEVADTWVADGFILTDNRALAMLANDLGWADMSFELRAKVILHPNLDEVAREQGYKNAKAMIKDTPDLANDLVVANRA